MSQNASKEEDTQRTVSLPSFSYDKDYRTGSKGEATLSGREFTGGSHHESVTVAERVGVDPTTTSVDTLPRSKTSTKAVGLRTAERVQGGVVGETVRSGTVGLESSCHQSHVREPFNAKRTRFRRRKLHVTSLVPPSLDVDPCRAGPTSHDTYKARKRVSHARFPPAPNLFELGRKLRGYYRHLMVERAARARGVAHSVLQREVIRVRGATEGATTGDGPNYLRVEDGARERAEKRTRKVKLPEAKLERRLETKNGTAEGVGDEGVAEEGEPPRGRGRQRRRSPRRGVAAQSRRGGFVGPPAHSAVV
ncbi:hypothetical protein BHM03_00016498 [Ensete ventricosum]|nr:hypothetical protein BHM03_00016498 [Ensete ventricosum]